MNVSKTIVMIACSVIMPACACEVKAAYNNTISSDYDNFYAITEDGTLLCWYNISDEKSILDTKPMSIMDNVRSISGNYAIKEDNSLWTWGESGFLLDQMGECIELSEFTKVMDDIRSVSAGKKHILAVKNDNTLWGFGSNLYGQLAQGELDVSIEEQIEMFKKNPYAYDFKCTPDYINEPVKIMENVKDVKAGSNHSVVLRTDGSVFTFGSNDSGQLGYEPRGIHNNKPVKVFDNARRIFSGAAAGFAEDTDGNLFMWGTDFFDGVGIPNEKYIMQPEYFTENIKCVANPWGYVMIVKNNGELWLFGEDERKQKIMDNVDSVCCSLNNAIEEFFVLDEEGQLFVFRDVNDINASSEPYMDNIMIPKEYSEPYLTIKVFVEGFAVNITLNNTTVTFPDAQPFVDENDRTQIPIRALAELLDFNVSWNGDTLTAELTKDDTVVTIKIGENQITKNGETIEMDTAAKVVNDRTYIPLRFVGEALGCDVEWEN